MQKLKGKRAVITGANSGIGLATARLFIEEGAQVIITGRNAKSIEKAVQELGSQAHGIVSDAGKMDDLKTLQKEVSDIFPTIDILFANAGIAVFKPFELIDESTYDQTMNINTKGVFFTLQQLTPLLNEGGSIVLNATILVHSGFASASVYAASKGAVLSLAKSLAVELADKNIRVNSISPGPINTPIYGKMGMDKEAIESFATDLQQKIPLRRFGGAEEVAKAALFLSSDASSFVTGTEITVAGGKDINF